MAAVIDMETIKPALLAWMKAGSGLPAGRVIWVKQGAPRPPVPYATIQPRLALASLGVGDEVRPTSSPGVVEHFGQRRLTVSCNLYGVGAFARLEAAQAYTQTFAGRAAFEAAGLALLDRGEVRDLTELEDTQYEERAQLDLIFGLGVSSTEDVGYIAEVEITATFTNPDGTTAAALPITITNP